MYHLRWHGAKPVRNLLLVDNATELAKSEWRFFSVQQTCPSCNGSGTIIEEYCQSCHGKGLTQSTKKLSVTIPAGVDHGDKVRLSGEGNAISGGQMAICT